MRRDLIPVIRYRAVAVGNHLKKVAGRNSAEPVRMQIGRNPETALANHAVAVTGAAMTRAAIDIEAVPSALEQRRVDWFGNDIEKCAVLSAGMRWVHLIEFIAGDDVGRKRPGVAAIGEERVWAERFVFRLVLHVAAARRCQEQGTGDCHDEANPFQLPKLQSTVTLAETEASRTGYKQGRRVRCKGKNGCWSRPQMAAD